MSNPVPTGSIAGCISREAALKTGLSDQTKVVSVSHDQVAAAVGAGAFDNSVAVDGAGTVGSAMLTGVAIGVFGSQQEAADHMVEETITYNPRPEMHEKYMKIMRRYEQVYRAVRPLM